MLCGVIMEGPVFKGNTTFKFEMDLGEAGELLFGAEANAGVAFQIDQLMRYTHTNKYMVYTSCIYMICTHSNMPVHTVYNMYMLYT